MKERKNWEWGRENEPARNPLKVETQHREKRCSYLIGRECDDPYDRKLACQLESSNKMALMRDFLTSRSDIINEVLQKFEEKLGFKINLKKEQKIAIDSLLNGEDVVAVLPTGFGKSLIFQTFVMASQLALKEQATVLVVAPLNSLTEDQISEANEMGISAVSLGSLDSDGLKEAKFQILQELRYYKTCPLQS